MAKVLELFTSRRFYATLALAAVVYMEGTGLMDKATADALKTFLFTFITVGTADSVAKKFGAQA